MFNKGRIEVTDSSKMCVRCLHIVYFYVMVVYGLILSVCLEKGLQVRRVLKCAFAYISLIALR